MVFDMDTIHYAFDFVGDDNTKIRGGPSQEVILGRTLEYACMLTFTWGLI